MLVLSTPWVTPASPVSGNYVANGNGADSSTGGIGTDESASTSSTQLFYEGEAFGATCWLRLVMPSSKTLAFRYGNA